MTKTTPEEAQAALDRMAQSYKLMLNNHEYGEPNNADGTKTFPPWLRDCRKDLDRLKTLQAYINQPIPEDRREASEWVYDAHQDIDESRIKMGIHQGDNETLDRAERCLKVIKSTLTQPDDVGGNDS